MGTQYFMVECDKIIVTGWLCLYEFIISCINPAIVTCGYTYFENIGNGHSVLYG